LDREEWQAALVEFLKSRELFPSKGNTKNAALCLRKVGRFDESLDLFETLIRDFEDLSPTDRALADREIGELRASVGTVEIRQAPSPNVCEGTGKCIASPGATGNGGGCSMAGAGAPPWLFGLVTLLGISLIRRRVQKDTK
jgi:MYXO-CTERM domain-containing protein